MQTVSLPPQMKGARLVMAVGRAAAAAERDGAAVLERFGESVYVIAEGGGLRVEPATLFAPAWKPEVERLLARRSQ